MAEIKTPHQFNYLKSITSIDGRFRGRVEDISNYFSEFAHNKYRVAVEIEYLIAFLETTGNKLTPATKQKLRKIAKDFSLKDCEMIWDKDIEINHDTKSVEYFLQNKLRKTNLGKFINFLHFGLTTMDIDYTALALQIKDFTQNVYVPLITNLVEVLGDFSNKYKGLVMLARTHGQVAVPTTAGKEVANFAYRIKDQLKIIKNTNFGAKVSGAVGNYNALVAAYPEIDWPSFSIKFLDSLGLESYPMTTQIEPLDKKIEFIQIIKRINLIIAGLDVDFWRYLAIGYLVLRDEKGHVGSSTMPQKINPIGFELSESYCFLANGIFEVMERRLPINRWQRDLTDKYLLRDLGQAFAMSVLAYESTTSSLKMVGFNKEIIDQDLENHPEAIAEGIQTILRTVPDCSEPYEQLMRLTRGKIVTETDFEKFIEKLDIPLAIKNKLRHLSSRTYVGVAERLTERYLNEK
jgi:adenylosuccinate lyase